MILLHVSSIAGVLRVRSRRLVLKSRVGKTSWIYMHCFSIGKREERLRYYLIRYDNCVLK